MKFGKRLKNQIQETLPEWHDKFLSYKDLKKLLRIISEDGKTEAKFIHLLHAEIDKFNAFFVEKEEDFIIRQKELQEKIRDIIATVGPQGTRASDIEYRSEIGKIRRDIVNFHGEMVLLENYSNVNYTGLAKILKKYDKRTGHLLRLPFIEKVLQQPFFTTELITKLVKECETTMDVVFFPEEEEVMKNIDGGKHDKKDTETDKKGIFRSTVVALETMRELRGGSSTYSHLSLPPMNLPDHLPLTTPTKSASFPIQCD